jgi:hypothetical protein
MSSHHPLAIRRIPARMEFRGVMYLSFYPAPKRFRTTSMRTLGS